MTVIIQASKLRLFFLSALTALALTACSQENGRDTDLIQAMAYLDIADVYRDQGQFRSAFIEIQNALQLSPGNQRALLTLAQTNMDIGNLRQAIDTLTELNSQSSTNTEVVLLLAEAVLSANNPQQAITLLQDLQPGNLENQNQRNWILGNAYAANDNQSTAEQAFQSILSSDTEHVDARIGLSKLAYLSGDLESASQYIEDAEAISPTNIDLLIWQGAYASLNGQYPEAEQAYFEALEIMGNYDMVTSKRFSVLQAILVPLQIQQKNDEALRYSQIIAETPQGQLQNSYSNAVQLFQQGDYSQAEEALNNALATAPDHPDSNILMGMTNYALENYTAAAESLANVVGLASTSSQPILTLAATHIQLGNPDSAIAVLREAQERFPDDASLLAMIGVSQQSTGAIEESIDSFNQALTIQPESAEIHFSLAGSYFRINDLVTAAEQLRNAIEINPDYTQAKTNLINLIIQQNDSDSAMSQVQAWLSEDPESTVNNNLAGRVALFAGDTSAARNYFNASLNSDPANSQARMLLARVAMAEENFLQAETQLDAILTREPTNAEALSGLLALGMMANSESESIEKIEGIIGEYPDSYTAPLVLSQYFIGQEELQNALEYAEQAYSRSENSFTLNTITDILVRQASVAASAQNLNGATRLIDRAVQLQGDSVRVLTVAAQVANQSDNSTLADSYIQQIKTLQPDTSIGFELEGDLLFDNGDLEAAASAYQQGWDLDRAPNVGAKLSRALTALGQPDQAIQLLEDWLVTTPDDPSANLLRALTHQDNSQDADAVEHYEVAYRSVPDNLVLLNNLAWLYQDSSPARALELATRAVGLYSDNPDVLDTYGWILFKQGRQAEAADVLRRAQELAPQSEAIAEHLNEVVQ